MNSQNALTQELNSMLNANEFNANNFESKLGKLMDSGCKKAIFVDFAYFNEDRLKSIDNTKDEIAAKKDELKKACNGFIQFRKEYGIDKSMFHYEDEYLLYFHMGTADNDTHVKKHVASKFVNDNLH